MREHEHPQSRWMEVQHAQARRHDNRDRVTAPYRRAGRFAQADHARRWPQVHEWRSRRARHHRVRSSMRLLGCALIATLAVSAAAIEPVLTQAPQVVHGINGSWEGYPVRGDGFGSGVQPKTPVPGPGPIPEAPLKQPYLDE